MIDENIYDGQLSFFDAPPLRITKPLRLIETFSGIGSQSKALQRLKVPFESWGAYDIDPYAVKAYNVIHGTNYEPSDITKLKASDLNITDTEHYTYLLTYSFPCFTGDTMILTKDGLKEIKDVQVGDLVLTHNNRYEKVTDSKMTGIKRILILNSMCSGEVESTEDHRYFARTLYREWNNETRRYERKFTKPEWKPCKELTKEDYVGVAINQENVIPIWNGVTYYWSDGRKPRTKNTLNALMNSEDFWWIVGRYVGDGWHRMQGGVIICTAKTELNEVTDVLDRIETRYSVVEERTVYKVHIPSKEWEVFLSPFGRGAANKCIPGFVFDLPRNLCESFVSGYMSADGSSKDGVCQITTVSKGLAYGVAQLIAKAYQQPYRIYFEQRKPQHKIEGRIVEQLPTYQIKWKAHTSKQDKAFYDDGYIWCPIRSISVSDYKEVYDITVENDHSFTANGLIVHNCQDLSLAGEMKGMKKGSGTRSGLLWEIERLLNECDELPQILVMENVKQVISNKNKADFDSWRESLRKLGYESQYQVLNAKDYGVAQNRERCFMVSWLKSEFGNVTYTFPEPIPLKKRLRDYLEDEVDEKYYLTEEQIATFVARTEANKAKGNGFSFDPIPIESDTHTHTHTPLRPSASDTEDSMTTTSLMGMTTSVSTGKAHQWGKVYATDGLSPTLLEGDYKCPVRIGWHD